VFASHEVVLFGAGIESGAPAYVAIALAGTIGYVIGSVGGWAVGIYGGRPFAERHGRWLHLSPKKLERADRWFDRYGDMFVLFGRVAPVLRSFVAIPAGIGRMPLGRYTLLTVPGSAAWCFALAGVGWALGANWERFHDAFRFADYAIVAAVVALVAVVVVRWRSSRLARRAPDTAR
jgi:membrane protein DedA with SNARE-associated domain